MNTSETIASILVTAALSLPCVAFASGTQHGVPGSTDEARWAAQRAPQQSASTNGYDDPAAILWASSTDEARALAAKRQVAPAPLAMPTDRIEAGVAMTPGSTDEARASFGRRLMGSFEQSARHA